MLLQFYNGKIDAWMRKLKTVRNANLLPNQSLNFNFPETESNTVEQEKQRKSIWPIPFVFFLLLWAKANI